MLDTGNYHLICSDAFVELPKLPPNSVDALITDPPYCSGGTFASDRTQRDPVSKYEQTGTHRTKPTFGGDQKDQRSWIRWTADWLRDCYQSLKVGAPFAIFVDWRQLPALTDAVQMADFVWRGIAVNTLATT